MPPLLTLVLICLLMAIAAYLCGMAPMTISLSPARLNSISVFGSGLLVGTALLVIIPEGAALLQSSGDVFSVHTMGIALLFGFLCMFVIDRLPHVVQFTGNSNHFIPIDLGSFRVSAAPGESEDTVSNNSYISTALGFIVHALADGVALGATVAAADVKLEILVFLAILIHKAPASFGLTAVLLREAPDRSTVHKALIAFAAAAPLGAVLTYGLVQLLGVASSSLVTYWSAFVLLLSGGTFLFVAMHVLDECKSNSSHDLLFCVIGMVVPMVTYLVPEGP